jgi:hypothetical protein
MQKYIWFAQYTDGSMLCEFEPSGKENLFRDIDRTRLRRFGLMGVGNVFSFDTKTGEFDVNGKKLSAVYDVIPLIGADTLYNDIITFKDAEATFNPGGGTTSRITKFSVGYKTKITVGSKQFNLRLILALPEGGQPYFSVRLVCNEDVAGKLTLKLGESEETFEAPLKANHGGELNWLIPQQVVT